MKNIKTLIALALALGVAGTAAYAERPVPDQQKGPAFAKHEEKRGGDREHKHHKRGGDWGGPASGVLSKNPLPEEVINVLVPEEVRQNELFASFTEVHGIRVGEDDVSLFGKAADDKLVMAKFGLDGTVEEFKTRDVRKKDKRDKGEGDPETPDSDPESEAQE